jgi:transposase
MNDGHNQQRMDRGRNLGRLKDFRRVATRYDKLARNFFSGVLIAAAITWWI